MALAPGTRLGVYEVTAQIGAGGMGEVYRATDTNLKRSVAIKVLPASVAADADRLARFQREAEVLAALNHPNIGAIYGLERTPDFTALVMELIEGEDLSQRIARGAIPLDEALPLARQIADALEAAHDQGIIHRDLKPANIKERDDGTVKVLDFGLAKALVARSGSEQRPQGAGTASPTMTSPVLTRAGVILGTTAYMSPEQARGSNVDERTDVWAFACVLYEMLSGRQAFPGDSISDTIAAILEREPAMDVLPAATPEAIRRLLRRCLAKDTKHRLRHIADARMEIDDALVADSPPPVKSVNTTRQRQWTWLALAGVVIVLIGTGALWTFGRMPSASNRATARLLVVPSEPLPRDSENPLALSPDGRRLVYVGGQDRARRLYVRNIDQFDSQAIPGTEGADFPQFSPDGQWLAFIADGKLKRVSVGGGTPLVLSDAAESLGLSWRTNETILFSPGRASGLWSVSSSGGTPVETTTLAANEIDHRFPDVLPDGNGVVFSELSGAGGQQIYAQSLVTGERHRVTTGVGPHYLSTGHLVYLLDGMLYAVPFDAVHLRATGQAVPLLDGVGESTLGTPQLSFSGVGTMAYLSVNEHRQDALVWVDHAGTDTPVGPVGFPYALPRLSPDGRRLAVRFADVNRNTGDIYIYDLARGTWNRFTQGASITFPLWTPDGTRLTLGASIAGQWSIYSKSFDGRAPDETLLAGGVTTYPLSWSPDGDHLALVTINPTTAMDVSVLDRRKTGQPQVFLSSKDREGAPTFSPDGRWIAYVSDKSGRSEIYMRPFPGPGEEWTISTDGGNEPLWARHAPLLFFRQRDAMMVVDVVTAPTVSAGRPRRLFEKDFQRSNAYWPNYDVTQDGQRLLMVKRTTGAPKQINVVLNWSDELTKRVPTR